MLELCIDIGIMKTSQINSEDKHLLSIQDVVYYNLAPSITKSSVLCCFLAGLRKGF